MQNGYNYAVILKNTVPDPGKHLQNHSCNLHTLEPV